MKIESAFICDDVRQEGNGKFIFIGAYSQDILISSFPTALNLYIVISARFENANGQEIEIEARLSDQLALKGKLTANIAITGFGFLPILIPLVNIMAPGDLVIRLKADGSKWREVSKISIKLGTSPTVQASAPTA